MAKLRTLTYLVAMLIACSNLMGCVPLAAGLGAAGGYVVVKHYDAHQANAS